MSVFSKFALAALLALSLVVLTACGGGSDWGYRKLLPASATEIKEFHYKDDFLPDYEYYLKAKMSRSDFQRYCDTLGLKLHHDSSRYTDDIANLTTGGGFSDSIKTWWNNTIQKDSLFVWQRGHEWNIARYVDGAIYLYAHEH